MAPRKKFFLSHSTIFLSFYLDRVVWSVSNVFALCGSFFAEIPLKLKLWLESCDKNIQIATCHNIFSTKEGVQYQTLLSVLH